MNISRFLGVLVFLSFGLALSAQTQIEDKPYTTGNKGKFYLYWGWNWDWYSRSDIRFQGTDYDFTINNAIGKDRQTRFDLETYFGLGNITTPQYNFRVGYFWNDHWSLSLGSDHMKYVMQFNRTALVTGFINDSGSSYDGIYNNTPVTLTADFVVFEHTDGLNYGNIEVRRHDEILNMGTIRINSLIGLGSGVLIPRTNATIIKKDNWDQFHLSGYGISGVVGLNVSIGKRFFAQSEFKSGYMNMPDIRTTNIKSDKASQDFFFYQLNVVFGATLGKGK